MRSIVLSLTLWTAFAASALAQRVIFPTPADGSGSYYTSQNPYPAATAPGATYAPPGATYSYPGQFGTQVPSATLNGQIQPAPAFDPYGVPAAAPTYAAPATGVAPNYPSGFVPNAIRLLQEVRGRETWLARDTGNDGFGFNEVDLTASFGIPFFSNPAPIVITPGFDFHFWDGPNSGAFIRDLPPRVYDAFLTTSWRPEFNQIFSADLAVTVGVFSDFQYVDSNSLRVLGRGVGMIRFNPQFQLAVGAWYLNRLRTKILPAGGVIWTPNNDSRFEILFPNPKLAHRVTTIGNSDVWVYGAGEYGGGQWTIEHVTGQHDVVNYNDIRIFAGVEWFGLRRFHGNFEVGYVFNREIIYTFGSPIVSPGDTVMLRAGLSY